MWVCVPACHGTDMWQAAIEWNRSQAGKVATLKLPASNEAVMLGQVGSAIHSAAARAVVLTSLSAAVAPELTSKISNP